MGLYRLSVVGIALVLLVSCGGERATSPGSDEEWHFLHDPQAGVAVRYPPGWDASTRVLTKVVWPVHRLAIASFRLDVAEPDPDCSPVSVLRSLPADGAFIVLFEYTAGEGNGPAPAQDVRTRPDQFTLEEQDFANYECFGPSYRIRFVEQNRVFQAHVSFGDDATAETKARSLDVLDTLVVTASSP